VFVVWCVFDLEFVLFCVVVGCVVFVDGGEVVGGELGLFGVDGVDVCYFDV